MWDWLFLYREHECVSSVSIWIRVDNYGGHLMSLMLS